MSAAEVEVFETALRASHDRLEAVVAGLSPDQVTGPSYASEWTIADVLSHLGSGAEIFGLILEAGSAGAPAPGSEQFQPIWARWNAKTPEAQAADSLEANARFLAAVAGLDEAARESFSIALFGGEQGLGELLRMRLGEHALHSWDVAVACDPAATLDPGAVELLVDTLPALAARAAKPAPEPIFVAIETSAPERGFILRADADGSALEVGDDEGASSSLALPAEALVRLVYGRLDDEHSPVLRSDGVSLDALRAVFPGF